MRARCGEKSGGTGAWRRVCNLELVLGKALRLELVVLSVSPQLCVRGWQGVSGLDNQMNQEDGLNEMGRNYRGLGYAALYLAT